MGDETIMTTSQPRFEEFLLKYPQTGINNNNKNNSGKGLPFWCQTRPEAMSYERVKGFLSIGMSAINVGVESGNEEFRKKELHRRPTNESVITGMSEAIRAGANIGANVIIGFPGETREMIFESIELMRKVKERAAEHVGDVLAAQRLSIMVHLLLLKRHKISGKLMLKKLLPMLNKINWMRTIAI